MTSTPEPPQLQGKPCVLVAYVYQRFGTPSATKALVREYIEQYADAQGYRLDSTFVSDEGQGERFTVRDLVHHVRACGASVVIVAGPAYDAMQAIRRLPKVRLITLSDIRAGRSAESAEKLEAGGQLG